MEAMTTEETEKGENEFSWVFFGRKYLLSFHSVFSVVQALLADR
jgi:hypothetical protein